jgi:hypothetical protein
MKALCQNCLRVVDVTLADYEAADYGQGMCICGGEVCNCSSCQYDIERLEKWNWARPFPYFKKPILFWTPEEGGTL